MPIFARDAASAATFESVEKSKNRKLVHRHAGALARQVSGVARIEGSRSTARYSSDRLSGVAVKRKNTVNVKRTQPKGRVLCVTSNFPRWRGDSTTPFVLTLARDLRSLGWSVDVLAPHAEKAALSEFIDDVHVERFRYFWPSRFQTLCYGGGAMVNLRKNPTNYLKLPAFVGAELLAVIQRLASRRYDLLHTHWLLPQGWVGAMAATALGIPHVATVHGGDVFSLKGRICTVLKSVAARSANAVTVNSSATENAVNSLCPHVSRLERIPMGVAAHPLSAQEMAKSALLRQQYRRGCGPLLVFVGRLVDEKGVEDLIRAVPIVRNQFPECSVLIVGEGQDRSSLEQLSASLGIEGSVHFLGWVAPEEVRTHLHAADIFVGPSRQAEGQGLTFLEAMAVETPVIATRLGGIVDSVIDEETGLLVDHIAPDQIAAAVCRLAFDAHLCRRLGQTALQMVRDKFSREASSQRFSHLFETLIASKNAANASKLNIV